MNYWNCVVILQDMYTTLLRDDERAAKGEACNKADFYFRCMDDLRRFAPGEMAGALNELERVVKRAEAGKTPSLLYSARCRKAIQDIIPLLQQYRPALTPPEQRMLEEPRRPHIAIAR